MSPISLRICKLDLTDTLIKLLIDRFRSTCYLLNHKKKEKLHTPFTNQIIAMINGKRISTCAACTASKIFIVPSCFNSSKKNKKMVTRRGWSYLGNANELHLVRSISNIPQAFDIVLTSRSDHNLRTPPKFHVLFELCSSLSFSGNGYKTYSYKEIKLWKVST